MANVAKSMSEADLAYQILQKTESAMYFRDLISKVLEVKGGRVYSQAQAMAEVHTQINMDSRFVHFGKGMWGLSEWVPQRGGSKPPEDTPAVVSTVNFRREKLLEEIQQGYIEAVAETEEAEE